MFSTILSFAAIKRADSSASSRRKVSSISASEASDHEGMAAIEGNSPGPEDSPNVFTEEKDLYESHLFDLPDEDDHLEQNMPWLRVITKLLNSFNYHCTHQNFCHPNCYRRQMRAARRMMEATRHVRFFSKVLGLNCFLKCKNLQCSFRIILSIRFSYFFFELRCFLPNFVDFSSII